MVEASDQRWFSDIIGVDVAHAQQPTYRQSRGACRQKLLISIATALSLPDPIIVPVHPSGLQQLLGLMEARAASSTGLPESYNDPLV